MQSSGKFLEKFKKENSDGERRKTYPTTNISQINMNTEKKSLLPQKAKELFIDERTLDNTKQKNNQDSYTKPETREDIPFEVIYEHEELAYEAGFGNAGLEKNGNRNTSKDEPNKKLENDYSINSSDENIDSKDMSYDNQEAEINPKYRYNTANYESEADTKNNHIVPIITIFDTEVVENETKNMRKSTPKVGNTSFMKPTQSSLIKQSDKSIPENKHIDKKEQSIKPKNFIKCNKQNLALQSSTSLEKTTLNKIEKDTFNNLYEKHDFKKSLRNNQIENANQNKLHNNETNMAKSKSQHDSQSWKYTYKVDNKNKTYDNLANLKSLNDNENGKHASIDNDIHNTRTAGYPSFTDIQIFDKNEFDDRYIISKFETLFTSLEDEYNSLLVYCNDFAIKIEDSIYCHEEFHRRFNKLLELCEDIKAFQENNRSSKNMNELSKYDSMINHYEIQTKEIVDILDYLRSFSSSKIFYEKVIAKRNKKFFLNFNKSITPNFPLNILSVYSVRFLIELHKSLDFTIASFCMKPLQYYQIFMHIKKFISDLKPKIKSMLQNNTELKEIYEIIEEVTYFYFDFTEVFKKNEEKCKKILKRYSNFPIKKNFYEKANYGDFKKIKFNFNKDFS